MFEGISKQKKNFQKQQIFDIEKIKDDVYKMRESNTNLTSFNFKQPLLQRPKSKEKAIQ